VAEQKHARLELFGELRGEVMVYQPMTVTQISEGGLRFESPFPVMLDSLHDFRLSLGQLSIVVKGRVVHCRLVEIAGQDVRYRSGAEFVEPSEHVRAAIRAFIDQIAAQHRPPVT
jgi:hypothetical protein